MLRSLDGKEDRRTLLVRYLAFALYCIASRNVFPGLKGFEYAHRRLSPAEMARLEALCVRVRIVP